MCFSPQRRTIFRHQNVKKCSEHVMFWTFSLPNVLFATAACNFSTSELQKVLRNWRALYIFTSKCAFRHSGVQFFDIRTSKSAPKLTCFVHFHFKMCFSPQWRAIFRHQNFKKRSETDVFCTFSLQNVLFATAACNFWFLLWAATSAPEALTGLLLDWPDTRIIEKTQHFATSLTFGADVSSFFWLSRYCIFFLLTWLLYSAFQLSILSEVFYLNFLRWFIPRTNLDLWHPQVANDFRTGTDLTTCYHLRGLQGMTWNTTPNRAKGPQSNALATQIEPQVPKAPRLPRRKSRRHNSPAGIYKGLESTTPATQIEPEMLKAPRLPRRKPRRHNSSSSSPMFRGHLKRSRKYHTCHANRAGVAESATPATQKAAAPPQQS